MWNFRIATRPRFLAACFCRDFFFYGLHALRILSVKLDGPDSICFPICDIMSPPLSLKFSRIFTPPFSLGLHFLLAVTAIISLLNFQPQSVIGCKPFLIAFGTTRPGRPSESDVVTLAWTARKIT